MIDKCCIVNASSMLRLVENVIWKFDGGPWVPYIDRKRNLICLHIRTSQQGSCVIQNCSKSLFIKAVVHQSNFPKPLFKVVVQSRCSKSLFKDLVQRRCSK